MNDLARRKLSELIAQYGSALGDDPRQLRALLSDLCPGCKREVHVLVAAAEQRVPAELLNAAGSPYEVTAGRLARRLTSDLALTEEAARWAVESWAVALGIALIGFGSQPAVTPAATAAVQPPATLAPALHPRQSSGQGANEISSPRPEQQRRSPTTQTPFYRVLNRWFRRILMALSGLAACAGIALGLFLVLRNPGGGGTGPPPERPVEEWRPPSPDLQLPIGPGTVNPLPREEVIREVPVPIPRQKQ